MRLNQRRVFDPLYGVTQLSELEYSIISSPEIQRLRYVRMCNINSLLVTGASEISRFEHVIGVLRLAKEWISTQGEFLSKEKKEAILAAALLHDFQTGPFGHSMQYVLEDNESDEQFVHDDIKHGKGLRFHQLTDANASFAGRPFSCRELLSKSWPHVAALIKGEGQFGPLISGSIDLDNLDNVVRLAYHVGVASSDDVGICLGLARDVFPSEAGLEISAASIPLFERWQLIRRRLYELLLLDWAEFSAKAMLTKAMELSVSYNLLGADRWLLTDLQLFDFLEKRSVGEAQEVGEIIKRLRCGDLYVPVFLGRSAKVGLYESLSSIQVKRSIELTLESEIRSKGGVKADVTLHFILDRKKTDRSIDVVIKGSRKEITIGSDSSQLLVGVFVSREISSEEKSRKVKNIVAEFLVKSIDDIEPIEDPMLGEREKQMELL